MVWYSFLRTRSVFRVAARRLVSTRTPAPERTLEPIFKSCLKYKNEICLRDPSGDYTFLGLAKSSKRLSVAISSLTARVLQQRIAVICSNNAYMVISQWACWTSGQIAVPLNPSYPEAVIEYIFKDADVTLAITTPEHVEKLKNVTQRTKIELLVLDTDVTNEAKIGRQVTDEMINSEELNKDLYGQDQDFYNKSDALLMYTSGSTGKPKGALLSYKNLDAQIKSVISPWSINSKDCVLNVRSLYTTEGITAGLLAPFSVGGRCVDAAEIWSELLGIKKPSFQSSTNMNFFIGESWMYRSLIDEYETNLKKSGRMEDYIKTNCTQKIRLMISMCAPVPRSIHEKWEAYTGHQLIEVYSITEAGIVSTPTLGTTNVFGTVGLPVPPVKMRIMAEDGDTVIAEGDNSGTKILGVTSPVAGTLLIKGDTLARKYWGKKIENLWTKDGWFRTGDIVSYNRGVYNILGKDNCDIVKSKSYKVSLLQIEAAILDIPSVKDVAAFHYLQDGNPTIAAAVIMKNGKALDSNFMRSQLLSRFPEYAVPSIFVNAKNIPRNHKGSLVRPDIASLYSQIAKLSLVQ
ncbi:malonate--CoA ligase ACSF3, mitochondrial isoform X2 [Halyomorpha halys]|uniref:malonate--CoA ligase ACSF3, mitochondrial isoform X2 n=1 Tax=Halyomorpha halys TaxID=286706 RepID=UPI0006D51FD8|nr:acyl-CoA synthetase family member 3, mitochondrial isoform X2 [Halyomorpha halys]